MIVDAIVEEVREIREAHAARFNFDPKRIIADLKQQERKSGETYVSFAPRPATKTIVAKIKLSRRKRA